MMLRSTRLLKPLNHLGSRVYTSSAYQRPRRNGLAVTIASAVATGSAFWLSFNVIHNDTAAQSINTAKPKTIAVAVEKSDDPNTLHSLVWGSNANKTLSPALSADTALRTPSIAHWLDGVALRDLQLHQTHAACVDARGDVYQWGSGFFGDTFSGAHLPKLTLRGKNIIQLQLTDNKIYALSASGKVYCLSSQFMNQELLPGSPTPSSDSWWGTGWLWGEDEAIDYAQLIPTEKLGWRESFVSIKAGQNHLLGLTSNGRVFAHPVNKQANHYGQLGFSKFSIPDPASVITKQEAHLHVELIPKSLADPFVNSSRGVRIKSTTYTSQNLVNVDDTGIKFCPYLFEVPVLRGVKGAEIAAGARTSFVRTPDGRVLGWGANEYGQIGLGANVALDTITVPTEVVLWRFVPTNIRSKCLDVSAGGDLTSFIVEREATAHSPTTIDVLMAGNGQHGGLGNNLYTSAQGNPSRVKGVSGLLQYSDRLDRLEPIKPEEISISPSGHVLLALNTSAESGVGGYDLMVWGRNYDSELGNGKKASLVIPTALESDGGERFMLMSRTANEVKDLHGKFWKKGVHVKQQAVAGYSSSVVYWKIAE